MKEQTNERERENREANEEERAPALSSFYPFYFIFSLLIRCRVMLLIIGAKQRNDGKSTGSKIKWRISDRFRGKVRGSWIPQSGRKTYSK